MDTLIYNAIISTNQLLNKQNTISNNLANISTTGYKEQFNYFLKNNPKNFYHADDSIMKEYYNLTPGLANYTQRPLDFLIQNNGWFVVKDKNGREAYTKNGHIKINAQSRLTLQNYEVVGENGSIKIPKNKEIKISSHGIVTTVEKRHHKNVDVKIGALKLVNLPQKYMHHEGNGLFYCKRDSKNHVILHDNNIQIHAGMLEGSNVNPSKNMIEMISNARQFDMQMKMISIYDKNSEYANQIISN